MKITFGGFLSKYASYYNGVRTHLSLGKDAPCTRPIERFGDIIAQPILGGLHHRYARILSSRKLQPIGAALFHLEVPPFDIAEVAQSKQKLAAQVGPYRVRRTCPARDNPPGSV
jgi:hypothetical protein